MTWATIGVLLLLLGVAGVVVAMRVEHGDGPRALGTFLVGLGTGVAGIAFLVVPNPGNEAHAILRTAAAVLVAGGLMALAHQAADD